MNKKLAKTIMIIVFAVFFKINRVNADTAVSCVYDLSDSEAVIVNIDTDDNISKKSGSFKVFGNWDEEVRGFSGRNFYKNNNHQCPSYAVYIDYVNPIKKDALYFANDISTMNSIRAYAEGIGSYKTIAVGSLKGTSASDPDVDYNPEGNVVNLSGCKCGGNNAEVKFTVNNMTLSTVSATFNGEYKNATIQNWSEPGLIGVAGVNSNVIVKTNYYYAKDLGENKCPEYAILAIHHTAFGKDAIFLSDSSDAAYIKENVEKYYDSYDSATAYQLSCDYLIDEKEDGNGDPNKEKEYEDPDIAYVITPLDYNLDTYSCGGGYLEGIPARIPMIGKIIYNFVQILVPIVIILLGSIDLVKAVMAQKEDEIKKNQQVFLKRLVSAALIFFVFAIVKLVVSLVSNNSSNVISCVDCIIRNNGSCELE